VHLETILRWLRSGKLRGVKLPGGTWRVPREELDRILMRREVGGE
jgi:excisionase family DNA binding protein